MRPRPKICCVVLALVAVPANANQDVFGFPVPEGFVSLKEDDVAAGTAGVDQHFIDEAQGFDAYGIHFGSDGVDATYMAKVFSGALPLDNLPEFAAKAIASKPVIGDARVLSTRRVDIAGVQIGRIEIENVLEGVHWQQLLLLLPARDHWAVVKVVAHVGVYPVVSAKVEAIVPGIRGIAAPSGRTSSGKISVADEAQGRLGLLLAVGGFVGLILNKVLRRKPGRRGA